MRLLYLVHQYFPRHVGGVEVYTRGLARRAIARGDEVCVVSYVEAASASPLAHGPRREVYEGAELVELHANLGCQPDRFRCEYDSPQINGWLEDELRRFAPDVVHLTHGMKLGAGVAHVVRAAGIPLVISLCDYWAVCPRATLLRPDGRTCRGPEHGLDCVRCLDDLHRVSDSPMLGWSDRWLVPALKLGHALYLSGEIWRHSRPIPARADFVREALLQAQRLVVLSPFLREILVENGYPAERLELLRHGLEADGLAPAERPADAPLRVAFIGSLVPHKGADLLLEALARIPEARLRCTIWGALVSSRPHVRELIKRAQAEPRVRLAGGFEPGALGEVLREVDLLVVPCRWFENEPLVIKAALHLGIAVLASRIGSLVDQLRGVDNARLVEPGDVAALADELERAAAAPERLAGPPRPVKTMDQHAEEIFAIYGAVV